MKLNGGMLMTVHNIWFLFHQQHHNISNTQYSHCCFLQTFFTFSFLIFCEHWIVQWAVVGWQHQYQKPVVASIYLRIVFVGRGEVLFGPTAADPLFAIKETVWRKASCVLWVDNEKINQIYFSVSFQGFNYWTNYLSTPFSQPSPNHKVKLPFNIDNIHDCRRPISNS